MLASPATPGIILSALPANQHQGVSVLTQLLSTVTCSAQLYMGEHIKQVLPCVVDKLVQFPDVCTCWAEHSRHDEQAV